MKRKSWLVTIGFLCVSALYFSQNAYAETQAKESSIGIEIEEGTLEILAARPLNFGTIKYSAKEQVLYPIIENLEDYTNIFALDTSSNFWSVAKDIGGYSLVDIADNRRSDSQNRWSLSGQLTPLVNDTTGESLELKMKIQEVKNLFGDPTPSYYKWFLLNTNNSVNIYGRSGESAQGAHSIDVFTNLEKTNPGTSYTSKNISLVIPANSKISSVGSYSATIKWTLTDSPGVYPIG